MERTELVQPVLHGYQCLLHHCIHVWLFEARPACICNAAILSLEQVDDKILVEAEEAKDEDQLFAHLLQLLAVVARREVAAIV